MRLAIIGATGMVGRVMLKVLSERRFPFDQLVLAASEKSLGTQISSPLGVHEVVSIRQALDLRPDIALFSAGGQISAEWAPKFAETGCYVVDNSSAWRMDESCHWLFLK
jgi:aspartate-semialdehyde dehydrogenase